MPNRVKVLNNMNSTQSTLASLAISLVPECGIVYSVDIRNISNFKFIYLGFWTRV